MLKFVEDLPDPGEQEEWVEPIAFFPADLPDLKTDPFGWTAEELKDAARLANRWRNEEPLTVRLAA